MAARSKITDQDMYITRCIQYGPQIMWLQYGTQTGKYNFTYTIAHSNLLRLWDKISIDDIRKQNTTKKLTVSQKEKKQKWKTYQTTQSQHFSHNFCFNAYSQFCQKGARGSICLALSVSLGMCNDNVCPSCWAEIAPTFLILRKPPVSVYGWITRLIFKSAWLSPAECLEASAFTTSGHRSCFWNLCSL